MDRPAPLRLPDPCLVVLVGASGSGKSTWARRWFGAERVVSSDGLRAVVGTGHHDQKASADAFAVLDEIVSRRLRRRLATVVDSTGLDAPTRLRWLEMARGARIPAHAVVVTASDDVCRKRNAARDRKVPAAVLTGQLKAAAVAPAALADEGWDGVHHATGAGALLVPPRFLDAPAAAARQAAGPLPLRFGLHLSRFDAPSGGAGMAGWLTEVAAAAEAAGFTSLWVMDHLLQIPQIGREWEDMPEAYATLAFLAGRTTTIDLGVLVGSVTLRHPVIVAKLVATLDVLSGGRARCGLGAGWHQREHQLLGIPFPPAARRLDALEDALRLLPLLWGPGSPAFTGRTVSLEAATCYPRPRQDRIPLLVGGQGERRTLRLAARHADAVNLFGDPDLVQHKRGVLAAHCAAEGRDPGEVTITHLSQVALLDGPDRALDHPPDRTLDHGPGRAPDQGTLEEQVGRYRGLAEAGVHEAIIRPLDLAEGGPAVERLFPLLAPFVR
jgi:F420-dependent oxidoreductase-like protein